MLETKASEFIITMAKYDETTHIHPFTWDQVAGAFFQRYPNPFATHVLTEDTLHRELRDGGGALYTRRFITKTNPLPKWGEAFVVNMKRYVPLVEESVVDHRSRIVTTYTRNVGLSRFMSAVERVRYMANPDSPADSTLAVKEVWIESGLYGLRSAVKSFGLERFKRNCHRATDGFNHVIAQLAVQQAYLKDMKMKQQAYLKDIKERKLQEMIEIKQEMKHRGEILKESAKECAKSAAADLAKSGAILAQDLAAKSPHAPTLHAAGDGRADDDAKEAGGGE